VVPLPHRASAAGVERLVLAAAAPPDQAGGLRVLLLDIAGDGWVPLVGRDPLKVVDLEDLGIGSRASVAMLCPKDAAEPEGRGGFVAPRLPLGGGGGGGDGDDDAYGTDDMSTPRYGGRRGSSLSSDGGGSGVALPGLGRAADNDSLDGLAGADEDWPGRAGGTPSQAGEAPTEGAGEGGEEGVESALAVLAGWSRQGGGGGAIGGRETRGASDAARSARLRRRLATPAGLRAVAAVASRVAAAWPGPGTPRGPCPGLGVRGLVNLGNTCFFNSAVQCLMAAEPLTRYFLEQSHLLEVNPGNPLGQGGALASAYAALLGDVWSDAGLRGGAAPAAAGRALAPYRLKSVIGRSAPQFAGFGQQDSQELVSFLLDGLHEDCNRVLAKPPTEAPRGSDRDDDASLARRSWAVHQRRNQSAVVDLFQGQLRSRLECPACANVSVTFDPYMFLGVPLPARRKPRARILVLPGGALAAPAAGAGPIPPGGAGALLGVPVPTRGMPQRADAAALAAAAPEAVGAHASETLLLYPPEGMGPGPPPLASVTQGYGQVSRGPAPWAPRQSPFADVVLVPHGTLPLSGPATSGFFAPGHPHRHEDVPPLPAWCLDGHGGAGTVPPPGTARAAGAASSSSSSGSGSGDGAWAGLAVHAIAVPVPRFLGFRLSRGPSLVPGAAKAAPRPAWERRPVFALSRRGPGLGAAAGRRAGDVAGLSSDGDEDGSLSDRSGGVTDSGGEAAGRSGVAADAVGTAAPAAALPADDIVRFGTWVWVSGRMAAGPQALFGDDGASLGLAGDDLTAIGPPLTMFCPARPAEPSAPAEGEAEADDDNDAPARAKRPREAEASPRLDQERRDDDNNDDEDAVSDTDDCAGTEEGPSADAGPDLSDRQAEPPSKRRPGPAMVRQALPAPSWLLGPGHRAPPPPALSPDRAPRPGVSAPFRRPRPVPTPASGSAAAPAPAATTTFVDPLRPTPGASLSAASLHGYVLASLAPLLALARDDFPEAAEAAAAAAPPAIPPTRRYPGGAGCIGPAQHNPPIAAIPPAPPGAAGSGAAALAALPFRLIVDARHDGPRRAAASPDLLPLLLDPSLPLRAPSPALQAFDGLPSQRRLQYQPLRVWVILHPRLAARCPELARPPPGTPAAAPGESRPGLAVDPALAEAERSAGAGGGGGRTTLADCLRLFNAPERLGESDAWYCPRCKDHVRATKTLTLWDAPPVLVIQLKRFAFSQRRRARIDTRVDFPVSGLDLSPFLASEAAAAGPGGGPAPVYDLFGVSEHMGGLGGGHYTASVKGIADGRWYDCNDSSVRPSGHDGSGAVTSAAYLLFYRRRGCEAYAAPTPRTADEAAAEAAAAVERQRLQREADKARREAAKARKDAGEEAEERESEAAQPPEGLPLPRVGKTMTREEYSRWLAERAAAAGSDEAQDRCGSDV